MIDCCAVQALEECETLGIPPTEQGRNDLELKIEEAKENIRKAEVQMMMCLCVCVCVFECVRVSYKISILVFKSACMHRYVFCNI